jgi:hypothetical protein
MNAIDHHRPEAAASAEDWARFLRPLLAAMNQQPSREQFNARCVAIAFALPEVPASMLVPWRQRDAMRAFKFLPSPAEIADWIGPALREERESLDRRQRLSGPNEATSSPASRAPEEIAAVQAKARAVVAELTHTGPKDRPAVKPAPLSDGALLAMYRRLAAEGNAAAAIRAGMIEQRIAAHG